MRKLAVLAVLSLLFAADAWACTCLPVDLDRDLPGADGAMIGTVLERSVSGTTSRYRFRVEQVYKGDVEDRAVVFSAADGAACGLELAVGQRVGLLLNRDGDVWRSSLCRQVDPADFLALTKVQDNALPSFNWGGIVVGILILGLGILALLRKRRTYSRLR
jgi:hypothetical protein